MGVVGFRKATAQSPADKEFGWEHQDDEKDRQQEPQLGWDLFDSQQVQRQGKSQKEDIGKCVAQRGATEGFASGRAVQDPAKTLFGRLRVVRSLTSQQIIPSHVGLEGRQILDDPCHEDCTEES